MQGKPIPATLVLTGKQIEILSEFAADDPDGEISIGFGDANSHSGPGLYAWSSEYPDEGSIALFEPPKPKPELDLSSDAPLERKCEPTGNGETCEVCQ